MAPVSPAKANQLLVTGILQVLFGSATFALVYLLYGDSFNVKHEILNETASYWTSIPVVVVGLIGVLAGISKKSCMVNLYLVGSTASFVLGILVCVTVGIQVNDIRGACGEDSDCKNSSIAMLLGTLVLMASLVVSVALWAAVKSCQVKWGPSKKTRDLRVVGEYRADGACAPNHEPSTRIVMVNHAAEQDPPRDNHVSQDGVGVVNLALEQPSHKDENERPTTGQDKSNEDLSIESKPNGAIPAPVAEDKPDSEDTTSATKPSEGPSTSDDKPCEAPSTDDKPCEGSSTNDIPNDEPSTDNDKPNEEPSTDEKPNEEPSTGALNAAYDDDNTLLTYL